MLTARTGQKGNSFLIILEGTLDEDMDLDKLIGPLPSTQIELYFYLSGIKRVNSVGVKSWIRYFNKIAGMGVQFTFWECSPPIVNQLNMVANFSAGGNIGSIKASYACEKCGKVFLVTLMPAQIKARNFEAPDMPCPLCKTPSSLDELPQTYFKFLMR